MTAAPQLPGSAHQIGLFDAPGQSDTKVCVQCGRTRKANMFAWKNPHTKTEREDVCSTCRINKGGFGKQTKRKAVGRDALIDMPHPSGIVAQPPPLWTPTKGETVKFMLNDQRTGKTILVQGVIVGVKDTKRIERIYGRVRSMLIAWGWQIAEIRSSVVAPLLERTAREGRAQ